MTVTLNDQQMAVFRRNVKLKKKIQTFMTNINKYKIKRILQFFNF